MATEQVARERSMRASERVWDQAQSQQRSGTMRLGPGIGVVQCPYRLHDAAEAESSLSVAVTLVF